MAETQRSDHGENIGNQIGDDAYGKGGTLNEADVWYILDQMQTNIMDDGDQQLYGLVTKWLRELETAFPDMQTM